MSVGGPKPYSDPASSYAAAAIATAGAVAANARVATFDAAVAQESGQPRIRGIGSKLNANGEPTGVVTNVLV